MRIYRVERRFCTQREDLKVPNLSECDSGGLAPNGTFKLTQSWNKEPRSPYGWVGCDNSDETYNFLDKNGISIGSFSHINGNAGVPHRPGPGNDKKLIESALFHFGVEVQSELPPKWHKEFYFGFESEVQFREWFDKEDFDTLHYKGYYLAIYEVSNNSVLLGSTQLMFKRADATQVDFILF